MIDPILDVDISLPNYRSNFDSYKNKKFTDAESLEMAGLDHIEELIGLKRISEEDMPVVQSILDRQDGAIEFLKKKKAQKDTVRGDITQGSKSLEYGDPDKGTFLNTLHATRRGLYGAGESVGEGIQWAGEALTFTEAIRPLADALQDAGKYVKKSSAEGKEEEAQLPFRFTRNPDKYEEGDWTIEDVFVDASESLPTSAVQYAPMVIPATWKVKLGAMLINNFIFQGGEYQKEAREIAKKLGKSQEEIEAIARGDAVKSAVVNSVLNTVGDYFIAGKFTKLGAGSTKALIKQAKDGLTEKVVKTGADLVGETITELGEDMTRNKLMKDSLDPTREVSSGTLQTLLISPFITAPMKGTQSAIDNRGKLLEKVMSKRKSKGLDPLEKAKLDAMSNDELTDYLKTNALDKHTKVAIAEIFVKRGEISEIELDNIKISLDEQEKVASDPVQEQPVQEQPVEEEVLQEETLPEEDPIVDSEAPMTGSEAKSILNDLNEEEATEEITEDTTEDEEFERIYDLETALEEIDGEVAEKILTVFNTMTGKDIFDGLKSVDERFGRLRDEELAIVKTQAQGVFEETRQPVQEQEEVSEIDSVLDERLGEEDTAPVEEEISEIDSVLDERLAEEDGSKEPDSNEEIQEDKTIDPNQVLGSTYMLSLDDARDLSELADIISGQPEDKVRKAISDKMYGFDKDKGEYDSEAYLDISSLSVLSGLISKDGEAVKAVLDQHIESKTKESEENIEKDAEPDVEVDRNIGREWSSDEGTRTIIGKEKDVVGVEAKDADGYTYLVQTDNENGYEYHNPDELEDLIARDGKIKVANDEYREGEEKRIKTEEDKKAEFEKPVNEYISSLEEEKKLLPMTKGKLRKDLLEKETYSKKRGYLIKNKEFAEESVADDLTGWVDESGAKVDYKITDQDDYHQSVSKATFDYFKHIEAKKNAILDAEIDQKIEDEMSEDDKKEIDRLFGKEEKTDEQEVKVEQESSNEIADRIENGEGKSLLEEQTEKLQDGIDSMDLKKAESILSAIKDNPKEIDLRKALKEIDSRYVDDYTTLEVDPLKEQAEYLVKEASKNQPDFIKKPVYRMSLKDFKKDPRANKVNLIADEVLRGHLSSFDNYTVEKLSSKELKKPMLQALAEFWGVSTGGTKNDIATRIVDRKELRTKLSGLEAKDLDNDSYTKDDLKDIMASFNKSKFGNKSSLAKRIIEARDENRDVAIKKLSSIIHHASIAYALDQGKITLDEAIEKHGRDHKFLHFMKIEERLGKNYKEEDLTYQELSALGYEYTDIYRMHFDRAVKGNDFSMELLNEMNSKLKRDVLDAREKHAKGEYESQATNTDEEKVTDEEQINADGESENVRSGIPESPEGKSTSDVQGTKTGKGDGESRSDSTDSSRGEGRDTTESGNDSTRSERDGDDGEYLNSSELDYRISDDLEISKRTRTKRFDDNIAVIELISKLETEGRNPTSEEQDVIARWSGWGGLKQFFYAGESRRSILEEMLTEEEFKKAERSTANAHYTTPEIVESMWKGLNRMGLNKGRILEPSVGSGVFLGMLPDQMVGKVKFTGVELDTVTSKVAKYLYPNQNIVNSGFERLTMAHNYFDGAIGNPPFGSIKLNDPKNKELNGFSIHNMMFAKSILGLREGGVMGMVITHNFLDKSGFAQRKYIAQKAKMVLAIRLPNTAFRDNAQTEVVTDIIFFQKKTKAEIDAGLTSQDDWIDVEEKDGATVSNYFLNNPEMVLGTLGVSKDMYGSNETTVTSDGRDLNKAIDEAIQKLPENIYDPTLATEDIVDNTIKVLEEKEPIVYGYTIDKNDNVVQRLPDVNGKKVYKKATYGKDKEITGTRKERIKSLLNIGKLAKETLKSDIESPKKKNKYRIELNEAYDKHIKKYGYLNDTTNLSVIKDDPSLQPLLAGLETNLVKETAQKHKKAEKSDIFSKRVGSSLQKKEVATTPRDAVNVSLRKMGKIDTAFMSDLLGQDEEKIVNQLVKEGIIFFDPKVGYVTRDEYLTGNIVAKIKEAEKLGLSENVELLNSVKPKEKTIDEISINFNANWIPLSIYKSFLNEYAGMNARGLRNTHGRWAFDELKVTDDSKIANIQVATEKGTVIKTAQEVINVALKNGSKKIYDRTADGKSVLNQELTAQFENKVKQVGVAFKDYIGADNKLSNKTEVAFNQSMNNRVRREFDGKLIYPERTLLGMNPAIKLRDHQLSAIWRGINEGRVLLDHVVGAGKTFAMIAMSMEQKRMGLINKPLFVVPNHLVGQWNKDIKLLYPNAKTMVVDDFSAKSRKRASAKMAFNDWDMIVMPHSSFLFIPTPVQEQVQYLEESVARIQEIVDSLGQGDGRRRSALLAQIEKIENRVQNRIENGNKDNVMDFAEIGIDSLFVDEAHEFKNLAYSTSHYNVSGLGTPTGSNKAEDLYMKSRIIQKMNNGRGIFFATGTPISNSVAEMYHMLRYMAHDDMKEMGIEDFDSWSASYSQPTSKIEASPTGRGMKATTSFNSFVNFPSLMELYRSFSDTVNQEDMNLPIPRIKGGRAESVKTQLDAVGQAYFDDLIERVRNLKNVDPEEDNMLKITSDASKASLDMRIISPSTPENPNGKVVVSAKSIKKIYDATSKDKGVQLVFCDLSTPKSSKSAMKKVADQYYALQIQIERHILNGDNSNASKLQDEVDALMKKNAITATDLDALKSDFSVYDALREKAIEMGIKKEEFAFIHDYDTDKKKEILFSKVREGEIRVLMGSSSKMGAGMNVQDRLVALHHLDAPWKPSDIEQREGRILRQGNKLMTKYGDDFEVDIKRYGTEMSLDTRRWSLLSRKATFIEQTRRKDITESELIEKDEDSAQYAEMMAELSGDPAFKEQVELRQKLDSLHAESSAYEGKVRSTQRMLADKKDYLEKAPIKIGKREEGLAEIELYETSDKKWQLLDGDIAPENEKLKNFLMNPRIPIETATEMGRKGNLKIMVTRYENQFAIKVILDNGEVITYTNLYRKTVKKAGEEGKLDNIVQNINERLSKDFEEEVDYVRETLEKEVAGIKGVVPKYEEQIVKLQKEIDTIEPFDRSSIAETEEKLNKVNLYLQEKEEADYKSKEKGRSALSIMRGSDTIEEGHKSIEESLGQKFKVVFLDPNDPSSALVAEEIEAKDNKSEDKLSFDREDKDISEGRSNAVNVLRAILDIQEDIPLLKKVGIKIVNEPSANYKGKYRASENLVIINSASVKSLKDLKGILAHEHFVHAWLKRGDYLTYKTLLTKAKRGHQDFDKQIKELEAIHKKHPEMGYFDKNNNITSLGAEEIVAYYVEDNWDKLKPRFIKRVTNWIKRKFKSLNVEDQLINEALYDAFNKYKMDSTSDTIAQDHKEVEPDKLSYIRYGNDAIELQEDHLYQIGAETVTTPRDFALAMYPLMNQARERLIFLITDANGKPVMVHEHSRGAVANSNFNINELISNFGLLGRDKYNIFMGHNHPSGNTEHSGADMNVYRKVGKAFNGTNLSFKGGMVINPKGEFTYYNEKMGQVHPVMQEKSNQKDVKIPVKERVIKDFDSLQDQEPISNSSEVIDRYSSLGNGILMMSHSARPVGFIPKDGRDYTFLKSGSDSLLSDIYEAMAKSNATGFIVMSYGEHNQGELGNLEKLAKFASIKFIDYIDSVGGQRRSLQEFGMLSGKEGYKGGEDFYSFDRDQITLSSKGEAVYSKLEESVSKIPFKKMKAWSLLKVLKRKVKPEELEYTGVVELLEELGRNGTITKEELKDFVGKNKVELKLVDAGDVLSGFEWEEAENMDGEYTYRYEPTELMEDNVAEDELYRIDVEETEEYTETKDGVTSFIVRSDSTLNDYVYDNLEDAKSYVENRVKDEMPEGFKKKYKYKHQKWALENGTGYKEMVITMKGLSFEDHHYKGVADDYSGTLAHLRYQMFGDAFQIEEIQSGLHQEGRKKGYRNTKEDKALMKEFEDRSNYTVEEYQEPILRNRYRKVFFKGDYMYQSSWVGSSNETAIDTSMNIVFGQSYSQLQHAFRQKYASFMDTREQVEYAPFSGTSSWSKLVFKYALAQAVANDAKTVNITGGKEQIDRYKLSRFVDTIKYNDSPRKTGTYDVIVKMNNGFNSDVRADLTESEIKDSYGIDVWNMINEKRGKPRTKDNGVVEYIVDGVDIDITDRGLEKYYNDTLSKVVKKYLKRIDPSVNLKQTVMNVLSEDSKLPPHLAKVLDKELMVWSFPVTDKIKEFTKAGQEMFSFDRDKFSYNKKGIEQKTEPLRENETVEAVDSGWELEAETKGQKAQRIWQDDLNRLTQVKKSIEKAGGVMEDRFDPYLRELSSQGRIKKRIDEYRDKYVRPIVDLIKGKNLDLEDVEMYLYAKHAPERNKVIGDRYRDQVTQEQTAIDFYQSIIDADILSEDQIARAKRFVGKLESKKSELSQTAKELDMSYDELLAELEDEIGFAKKVSNAKAQTELSKYKAKQLKARAKRRMKEPSEMLKRFSDNAFSGMSDKKAKEFMDSFDDAGITKDLTEISRYVNKIRQNYLNLIEESGLESEKTVDLWRSTYKDYMPLKGQEGKDIPLTKGGGKFVVRHGESRKALGRQSMATELLSNLFAQFEMGVIRAERNQIGNSFLQMVRLNPNEDVWTIRTHKGDRTINRLGEVEASGITKGMQIDQNKEFVTKVNGQEVMIEINDPILAKQMNGIGTVELGSALRFTGKINRFLASMSTSWNPFFVVDNFRRDIITATINASSIEELGFSGASKIALKTITNVPKIWLALSSMKNGIVSTVARKALGDNFVNRMESDVAEFLDAGGATGFTDFQNIEVQAKRLEKMVKSGKIKQSFESFFRVFEDINNGVEYSARLAVYRSMRKLGKSKLASAGEAKNITVNFNKKGEWGQGLNALYMFSNAGIQGSARLINALGKSRKADALALALVGVGFGFASLNRILGGVDDDDESYYDKLPDYVKDNNVILYYDKGKYVKLWRLPYGYNIFHTMGDTANSFLNAEKGVAESTKRVLGSVVDSFNPLGSSELTFSQLAPTVARPFAEISENTNFFGSPIMPEKMMYGVERKDRDRYFRSVSDMSKFITEKLGKASDATGVEGLDISPETLDHLAKWSVGGLGKNILDGFSSIYKDYKADEGYGDVPSVREQIFTRMLYGENEDYHDIGKYYEKVAEYKGSLTTFNNIKKSFGQRQAMEYKREDEKARLYLNLKTKMKYVQYQKKVRQINKELGRLRFENDKIRNNSDAILDVQLDSDNFKRNIVRINKLNDLKTDYMKQANSFLKKRSKQLKE